ncbi:FecR domain-containing protein [Porticoccaceae bacterium LTM1]|nr:FecR domain-containing protein [Porticoccaceae bacterium LTM1]
MMVNFRQKGTERQAARDSLKLFSGDVSSIELNRMTEESGKSDSYKSLFKECNDLLAKTGKLSEDEDLLSLVSGYPEAKGEAAEIKKPGRKTEKSYGAFWFSGISVAAALIVLAVHLGYFNIGTGQDATIQRYVTRVGEQRVVTLPDNSVVSLNTGSILLVEYGDDFRRLNLERGEAYFDVKPDSERPFSVDVGYRSITVLGTAFNLRRDPDQFQLAVVEGKVALHPRDEAMINGASLLALPEGVYSSKGGGAYKVAAGEVVDYNNLKHTYSVKVDPDIESYRSWTDGVIRFVKAPFSDVVRELNRYSAKKILIEDSSILNLPVWATVQVSDVSSALMGLEKTQPIRLVFYPDRIVIRSNIN